MAPSDYVLLNVFLSFNVGDVRLCHMITIVDDNTCEEPSERFFLSLTVETGENISIQLPLTEVVISDDVEPECGERCNTTLMYSINSKLVENEGLYDS